MPLQSSPHSSAVLEPKDAQGVNQRASKETHHKAAVATFLKPRSRDLDGKFDSSKTAGLKSGLGTGLWSGSGSDLGAGAGPDTHLLQTISAMPWSNGFDCMCSHSCQLQLQLRDGRVCTVAVSVHKLGLQWQVVLQPSFVLLNKAGAAVHLHYTGELMTCRGRPPGVSRGAEGGRGLSQPPPEAGSSFALEPEAKVGGGVRGQSDKCRYRAAACDVFFQLASKSAGTQACQVVELPWDSLNLKHSNALSRLFITPWNRLSVLPCEADSFATPCGTVL